MLLSLRRGVLAAAFLCSSFTLAYGAETYIANLDGATGMPQSSSSAIGVASARFDGANRTLNWRVSYSGMSGSPTAVVIRFAAPGAKSGVVVPVRVADGAPITGSVRLTDAEAAALAQGRLYFGLRSGGPGGGEIGGEVALMGSDGSPDGAATAFEARRPENAASNH
jgi:hypothetical protein